jgi:integrase
VRKAALSAGLLREIEAWKEISPAVEAESWVLPSENGTTPLSKDNCWRRNMRPKLAAVGLGWANFLVMRRTHASLMKALGEDGKLVADQMGHSLDVSQNCYTQSSVENRQAMVNRSKPSSPINRAQTVLKKQEVPITC